MYICLNMIYYFVHENIFVVAEDKDNITSSVQIGYPNKKSCLQIFNIWPWVDISAYRLYKQISKNTLERSRYSYKPI